MIHFLVAFAVLAHVLWWGLGLAMLAMPRPWRRFWPVLVVPAGLALQSAVVWAGAHAGLRGTLAYAWPAQVVPAVLLILALRRVPWRSAWVDIQRTGLVWLASAGVLVLLVSPLAWAAKGLTTVSLASCDAADYAAGARVLQEFASTDRSGFLGLSDVVRVQSADNFFDYWIRLNHFTPSALIAFNGAVLGCAPHELTSLLTMVLLAGSLPVVFWMARALVGFSAGPSAALALLYGLSPLTWYVVGHVAPGQLLAAMAVALITWAGAALWRGRLTWRRGAAWAGVLAIGYALLLGSYNFFIVLCLAPAVAYTGGLALWHRDARRWFRWLLLMLAPLAVCAVGWWGRVAGLVERFRLLRTYDFGWKIPALTPEGWLGMVSGPELAAWDVGGLRWILATGVIGLLAWAGARAWQERRRKGWTVAALVLPVLAGYALLLFRGTLAGTNASYDAFKLFTVFYPVTLPVFAWWVSLRWRGRIREWFLVMGVAAVVLLGNLVGTAMVAYRLAQAPLRVDGELRQLRKIEAMPDVASVNVLLPDMWSRLWANSLLLKKPQYFASDTYEARWHTALKGEWDLTGGLLAVTPTAGARRVVAGRLALVDTRGEDFLRVQWGDGWNGEEIDPATQTRWSWTQGEATWRVENPHPWPLRITCTLDGWAHGARDLELTLDGAATTATGETRALGAQRGLTVFPELTVPPGGATLRLRSRQPWLPAGTGGEARALGVCVFGLDVATRR